MRPLEEKLSTVIRISNFGFLEPGEHQLTDIYAIVKDRYPVLCDDSYLCSQNCKSHHKQAEWQHVVRGCLQNAKSKGVIGNVRRGVWKKSQTESRPAVSWLSQYADINDEN